MTDIVDRLRKWFKDVNAASAIDLMDEAAAEIERLRNAIRRLTDQDATLSVQSGNVTVTMDATLTAEEREAIEWFSEVQKPLNSFDDGEYVATLRKLLERLK